MNNMTPSDEAGSQDATAQRARRIAGALSPTQRAAVQGYAKALERSDESREKIRRLWQKLPGNGDTEFTDEDIDNVAASMPPLNTGKRSRTEHLTSLGTSAALGSLAGASTNLPELPGPLDEIIQVAAWGGVGAKAWNVAAQFASVSAGRSLESAYRNHAANLEMRQATGPSAHAALRQYESDPQLLQSTTREVAKEVTALETGQPGLT
jgi:hypothetical protein